MGKTISETILTAHAGHGVKAGDIAVVDVDWAYVQDGTGPLTVRQFKAMGFTTVPHPERRILFLDHASPSPRRELSNDHKLLREFSTETGAVLSDIGYGISHVVALEKYVRPGDIVVGADSHTCTGGAVCAFATGMGSTDVAVAFGLGKTWLRCPETFKIKCEGEFPKGVYSKDLMLTVIGMITAEGANYKALEFCGSTIAGLTMDARATLSNMAVECGAKVGLIAADRVTKSWLRKHGREQDYRPLKADPSAQYERVIEIDAASLKPTLSCPHFVDNVKTIEQVERIHVDQVFLGTSTNGRIEDLEISAKIIKGKSVKPGTRLIVTPGSREVYAQAAGKGLLKVFVDAGALVTAPGCGACVGVHEGILADGEVCVATQNRNFCGRMGNPNAFIYLASPALAMATAIEGKIADPRDYL